jgi:hypothetical protein
MPKESEGPPPAAIAPVIEKGRWKLEGDEPLFETLRTVMEASFHEADLDPATYIPTPKELKEIAEAVFWATTHPDEGRFPLVSVAFGPSRGRGLAVATPLDLTSRSLAALAPTLRATPSRMGASRIGVQRSAEGRLVIWGISLDHGDLVQIRGVRPCRVVFQLGLRRLGLLTSEGLELQKGLGLGAAHCALLFSNAFPNKTHRLAIGSLLEMLLNSMRERKHGGAIVVVPKSDPDCLRTITFPYALASGEGKGFDLLSAYLEEVAGRFTEMSPADQLFRMHETAPDLHAALLGLTSKVQRLLLDTVEQIAALTGIDGALVLNDDLEVLGFGAKLSAPAVSDDAIVRCSATRIEDLKPDGPRVSIASLGGTRRQSSARFVCASRGALALTLSHDGPASAALWCKNLSGSGQPVVFADVEALLE